MAEPVLARKLAKPVVATGLAAECTATLAIFPGDEAFRIVALRDGNGMTLDSGRWARLMDLSLASAGESYAFNTDVARAGPVWVLHFTRPAMGGDTLRNVRPNLVSAPPPPLVLPFSASVRIADHPGPSRVRGPAGRRQRDSLAGRWWLPANTH
jgi:hypothetical protein